MDRDRWLELGARVGHADSGTRFEALVEAYSEPHRAYHTSQHIDECLGVFDAWAEAAEHPDEVELAIWLHDVVYQPRKGDNEERSADLAAEWLRASDLSPEAIGRVRDLILVTRHQEEPATLDQALILDVDLHILGADEARYAEYETQVRREYQWVPKILFERRRAQLLRGFLERAPLFRTEAARARFEHPARRNLEGAIQALGGRAP